MHPLRASSDKSCLRGGEDVLGGQARPNGIKCLEPVEQVRILGGGDGASQGLVKMMMRVDQPRQEDVPGEVEHFIGCLGQLAGGTNAFNQSPSE